MRRLQTHINARTLVVIAFLTDLLAKILVLHVWNQQPAFSIGRGFSFILFENHRGAFGLPFSIPLLVIIGFAGLAWVISHLLRTKHIPDAFMLAIILGATSNVFDRLLHNFTTDYLVFFDYTAWNIADILIVVGLLGCLKNGRPTTDMLR